MGSGAAMCGLELPSGRCVVGYGVVGSGSVGYGFVRFGSVE